jgi:Fe-S cluster assembly protein SufD
MNITTGGTFIRNNLSLFLNGENIEAHLNGFFVGSKNRHVDTRTVVDHLMPRCESFQLYKGIAADKSTGVFNGKIFVRRDAQKTNAYQSSKNMLLGDEATVNAKPELEIYADDVKCSHGSSTGKLNEDALFYLRSRGLGIETARTLLLHAFAGEVFEKIRHEEFKELIIEKIRHIVGGLNTSHAG